jgi:hypothetical protein
MRHFVLPGAVAVGACGMIATTTQGQLVTPPGGALLDAPGLLCAPSIAVDVATVATGADHHLVAAARAEIQAPGWIALLGLSTEAWTNRITGGILPRHTCSRTVWGAAPMRTCQVVVGAVPVFNEDRPLTRLVGSRCRCTRGAILRTSLQQSSFEQLAGLSFPRARLRRLIASTTNRSPVTCRACRTLD